MRAERRTCNRQKRWGSVDCGEVRWILGRVDIDQPRPIWELAGRCKPAVVPERIGDDTFGDAHRGMVPTRCDTDICRCMRFFKRENPPTVTSVPLEEVFESLGPEFLGLLRLGLETDAVINEIAAHRREAGIAVEDVAADMETSVGAVTDIESTCTEPTLAELQRYAWACGYRLSVQATPRVEPSQRTAIPIDGDAVESS